MVEHRVRVGAQQPFGQRCRCRQQEPWPIVERGAVSHPNELIVRKPCNSNTGNPAPPCSTRYVAAPTLQSSSSNPGHAMSIILLGGTAGVGLETAAEFAAAGLSASAVPL